MSLSHANLNLIAPLRLIVPGGVLLAGARSRVTHLIGRVSFVLSHGLADSGHFLGT